MARIAIVKMFAMANSNSSLRAFATIRINDVIEIADCKVVDGQKGMFVSLPSKPDKNGKWWPTVKILNQELMESVQKAVIDHYYQTQATAGAAKEPAPTDADLLGSNGSDERVPF